MVTAARDAIAVLTTIPQNTIKVTAHDGWIYLDGRVNWRHQRIMLEDVVRSLPGVRGVSDSIIIEASLQ